MPSNVFTVFVVKFIVYVYACRGLGPKAVNENIYLSIFLPIPDKGVERLLNDVSPILIYPPRESEAAVGWREWRGCWIMFHLLSYTCQENGGAVEWGFTKSYIPAKGVERLLNNVSPTLIYLPRELNGCWIMFHQLPYTCQESGGAVE